MVHSGSSSTVLVIKKWSCWPCPMANTFSAGIKHIERSSTASYLLSSAVWLINSVSYSVLLKRFRSSVLVQMVVVLWWSSATGRLQTENDNQMPDPICELLGSSVASIIFPIKYTNTRCVFWCSKPRYSREAFGILFLV